MTRCLAAMLLVLASPAVAWEHPGGSERGLKYSPLAQIDRTNVTPPALAWTARTGERPEGHARAVAFLIGDGVHQKEWF